MSFLEAWKKKEAKIREKSEIWRKFYLSESIFFLFPSWTVILQPTRFISRPLVGILARRLGTTDLTDVEILVKWKELFL